MQPKNRAFAAFCRNFQPTGKQTQQLGKLRSFFTFSGCHLHTTPSYGSVPIRRAAGTSAQGYNHDRPLATNFMNHVIYVDKGVIILNKPPGLICQPQRSVKTRDGHQEKGGFDSLLRGMYTREGLCLNRNPYPVHRLDKGTTGCLVLARTDLMARNLSLQFQQRTVGKVYLALVRAGTKSFPTSSGQIRAAIKYADGRAIVDPVGTKPSLMDWELLYSSPVAPLSLLRLKLHTGQKHQLRVHLAYCLQAPILGDTLYSTKRPVESILNATSLPADRIFLHASELSFFRHKPSGRRIRLSVCAPLPKDFLKICKDTKLEVDSYTVKGGLSVDGVPISHGKLPELEGHWMNK